MNTNTATYCPEDNKLRLYVGRVPRPEYERLRAEGWTSTPKQSCDFVAVWTPCRRDTALEYADIIEDEDQSAEDRAADRAERFSGYLDKRLDEAGAHASTFDAGPSAFGFQSLNRAERAAARHDRHAGRALDAWSKAEYWQSRTAGVISHALYVSSPSVRMGRIKTLEAEYRKHQANCAAVGKTWRTWKKLSEMTDVEEQNRLVLHFAGSGSSADYGFQHPRSETVTNAHVRENGSDLYTLMGLVEREYGSSDLTGAEACALWLAKHPNEPQPKDDWSTHYELRLAYENQMLEAQGGRAAHIEMIAGGFIGGRQIQKVNKSAVTGRVVSVAVWGSFTGYTEESGYTQRGTKPCLVNIETERLAPGAYRAPTDEELSAFAAEKKERKLSAPAKEVCPLINPTDEDAERLQAIWNAHALAEREASYRRQCYDLPVTDCPPQAVLRITQAAYSAASKGSYARVSNREVFAGGIELENRSSALKDMTAKHGKPVCQVRRTRGEQTYGGSRVIILTDKPQKALPAAIFTQSEVAA